MTTITTVHPASITAPRGAVWAASAAVALVAVVQRMINRRRVATPRSRAEEAEAVRRYAQTLRASDPGMAADLFAAADRHDLRG